MEGAVGGPGHPEGWLKIPLARQLCSPAASRSVCLSVSPSKDGRPRAACLDGYLDPAPHCWEWGAARRSQGPLERWLEGLFAFPCTLYRRVYLMMGSGSTRCGGAGSSTRGWSTPGLKPAEHGEGWDPVDHSLRWHKPGERCLFQLSFLQAALCKQ